MENYKFKQITEHTTSLYPYLEADSKPSNNMFLVQLNSVSQLFKQVFIKYATILHLIEIYNYNAIYQS